MHRFFIPDKWITQDEVALKGNQAHQILHVLRLKPEDHILVVDDLGWEYEVEVVKVSGEQVQGKIVSKKLCDTEPETKITLYQALLKTDKFEFVLQKGVELGVYAFVPFTCRRCAVRRPGESKVARWEKIIREAAEQSKRGILPALRPVVTFEEACEMAGGNPSLLLWEGEKGASLRRILKNPDIHDSRAFNLFVGPEGGFPPEEIEFAKSGGIVPVGLGCRILRAETAGLVAVSAIFYETGEIG